jgi:excisionase family DNA binding protein
MTHERPRGLTAAQAAAIIGVRPQTVHQWVLNGRLPKLVRYQHGGLDLADVERLALQRWRPGHQYWITTTEAAQILKLSEGRVRQLVEGDRIPAVMHEGRLLYRRAQIEVIAHARLTRVSITDHGPAKIPARPPVDSGGD